MIVCGLRLHSQKGGVQATKGPKDTISHTGQKCREYEHSPCIYLDDLDMDKSNLFSKMAMADSEFYQQI